MISNIDTYSHVRGESIYLDDIPLQVGTLFAKVFDSTVAHAHIKHLDISKAKNYPGVRAVIIHSDITGENQIGGIIPDEALLAENIVDFIGMPIAIVVAENEHIAKKALKLIEIEFEPLPIIVDPREAHRQGKYLSTPRHFNLGDTETAWSNCAHIFNGKAESGGQEHLYIETQGAYAIPGENGFIKVYSSTQGPTAVQKTVSRVLGKPMHQVEVDTTRLGGGFGGKEDQASTWGAMCAIAAHITKSPVKYSLDRMEDMRMTGKRHPYSSDYKIGLDKDLNIIAYEAQYYQNGGAAADLSPAILERTLFHATNTYKIPNVKTSAYPCKTNLPPNTAFRGFGGPQGMFVIETAIVHAAEALGIEPHVIQHKNLLKTGDEFPYGQKVVSEAIECWTEAETQFNFQEKIKSIEAFNNKNQLIKKGYAIMPICFGISFTKTMLNQARSLVHVYTDGSVLITTGAVEMGQGVNTKMVQVAAKTLGIDESFVKINSTNTFRIANTSPTAASATADLNGKAVEIACLKIKERLLISTAEDLGVSESDIAFVKNEIYINGEKSKLSWKDLIFSTYAKRVSLSEHAHYTPSDIHFDTNTEKGHPFAYHVFGTSIFEITLDCIRGRYTVDSAQVIHDAGQTMNEKIDMGQCEGALVQGMGWMTMEELIYDKDGRLRSNALSTYKVPDIYSVPKDLDIRFLKTEKTNLAILQSKAVGEPPLMYGIGAYFAIRNAIKAFNPKALVPFDAPATHEKILLALYGKYGEI